MEKIKTFSEEFIGSLENKYNDFFENNPAIKITGMDFRIREFGKDVLPIYVLVVYYTESDGENNE